MAGSFGPEVLNILISSEETAVYLAKKFGVPDKLIRDADERQQLVQMAQQMQMQQQQGGMDNVEALRVDGFPRTKAVDEKISQDILALFNTPNGNAVLGYLRSITTDIVSGGNISDGELRHLEGQRYLIALIVKRMNHAQNLKKKEEDKMNEENVSTESATEDTTTHNVDSSSNSVADTNTRPDWLPEKFATAEDMAKSYGELESWKGKKEEDIRSAMQEEIEKEAFADRPETAGHYQIPESLDEAEAATNPLLKEWAEFAWENGYSQDEFAHWVNKFTGYMQEQDTDIEAVKTELGDNANQRIEAVQLFMNKFSLKKCTMQFHNLEHQQKELRHLSICKKLCLE